MQSQGGRGAGLASCALLAQPDLIPGTHAPRDSPSLASSSEKGPSFSETGHPLAPASRPLETPCLVPGRDAEVLGDLPPEVLNTIASARAPSTRRAYALRCPWRRQTQPWLCSVQFAPCNYTQTELKASGPQTSSLSVTEASEGKGCLQAEEWPTG